MADKKKKIVHLNRERGEFLTKVEKSLPNYTQNFIYAVLYKKLYKIVCLGIIFGILSELYYRFSILFYTVQCYY